MSILARRFLLSLVLAAALPGSPRALEPVDLELVLAVDASSSINRSEFNQQMVGLAEAFRHPRVQQAIEAAGPFGVAVIMIQWADSRHQEISVGWTLVHSAADCEAFAQQLDLTPRQVVGGGTAIGGALAFSMLALEGNLYQGGRQVIDVSGDGRANQGEVPNQVRDRAIAAGITVNGLAILNEDPALNVYYKQNVIGGPNAFVLTAPDYEAFRDAMIEKLVKEITGAPVAEGDPDGPEQRAAR